MLGRLGFWGVGACEPFHVAGSSILRILGHAWVPDIKLYALCEHGRLSSSKCAHVRPLRALRAPSSVSGHQKQRLIFMH